MLVETQLIAQVVRESIEDLRRATMEPRLGPTYLQAQKQGWSGGREVSEEGGSLGCRGRIILNNRVVVEIEPNFHYRED